MARAVVDAAPGTVPAQMVLIADRLAAGAPAEALAAIDAALPHAPADEGLHLARLAMLETLGDMAGAGAELARMAELFPANAGVRDALIQWHLRSGDPAGAEAVLRAAAARDPADPQAALTVVQFLLELEGPAAARAELDRLIAAAADPRPFQRARAGLDFAQGRPDAAIAALRALLAGAAASDATRDLQVSLAEMLAETGQAADGAALIETVLAGDRGHVAALKLRAKLAIDADRPDAAIQDLRTALTQAPRDPEILTVMALAHEREGSRELAGERLALAVEAAERAAPESLRYARFLMQDGRTGPAEGVVARRAAPRPQPSRAPRHARPDPPRPPRLGPRRPGGGAAARPGRPGDASARRRARDGEPAGPGPHRRDRRPARGPRRRRRQPRGHGGAGARAGRGGRPGGRRAPGSTDVLAGDPANLPARLLRAGLHAVRGQVPEAEALYRAVLADAPGLVPAHQTWYAFLAGQGRAAEAAAALAAGLAAAPGDGELIFLEAGRREAAGDPEGALALYETLYARDPGSAVLANNLASLLTGLRRDAAQPRARLSRRPPAARRRPAAVPGHLRLDPAPARRPGGRARLSRARRRGPARQRPGAGPPRRGRVRARPPTRRRRRATAARSPPPGPAARCRRPRPCAPASPRSPPAPPPRQRPGPDWGRTRDRRLSGPHTIPRRISQRGAIRM